MKHRFYIRFVLIMVAAFCCNNINAQDHSSRQSFIQEIKSPAIKDKKDRQEILNYQARFARQLIEEKNYNVSLDEEVIKVTIPADLLFEPNATTLSRNANRILEYYANRMRIPGMFTMVLAMYHDNTGSPGYCKNMTDERIRSIFDWFAINGGVKNISYYSFGDKDPMLDNNSIDNRRLNRRLEIYLIPGPTMIENAKRHLLR